MFTNPTHNASSPSREAFFPDSLATARTRRPDARRLADILVERAQHLTPPERLLVEIVYRDGRRAAEAAAALGLNTRVFRHRLRKLIRRLHSRAFLFVLSHHAAWPPTMRSVGVACYLEGRSVRKAAVLLNLTPYHVRKMHEAIAAMIAASGRAAA